MTPGTYTVRLNVGDQTYLESFEIEKDPRISAAQEDLEAQFTLLIEIRDKLSDTHAAVKQLRNVRDQVDEWANRTEEKTALQPISDAAGSIRDKLAAIENALVQIQARAQVDRLRYPMKLNGKLAGLLAWVASADDKPTEQSFEVFSHLSGQVDDQLRELQVVIDSDLEKFNALFSELEVPPIDTIPVF